MANMAQALRLALHYGEKNMELTNILGEDVGPPLGGVFTVTQGLKTAWNSPLDERGIIGTAMGVAMTGKRVVAEIQFVDYIFNSIDLLKLTGNCLWSSNGQYPLPLVVMAPNGAGIHGSIYHSHSFESWGARLAGWKMVMPSDPLTAYGLMLSALRDPNPVLYLIPKALLRVRGKEKIPGEPESETELKKQIDAPVENRENWTPRWPQVRSYFVPIGRALVLQKGTALTVISWGRSLTLCKEALRQMGEEGRQVELIDLCSLYPYDWGLIRSSILKTKKVLLVNEDTEVANFAEHLAYRITRECFYHLYCAPQVLAGKQVPGIGLHPNLEKASVPQVEDIKKSIHSLLRENP